MTQKDRKHTHNQFMQCNEKKQNQLLESKLRISLRSVMTKERISYWKGTQNQFMQCDDKKTELVIGKQTQNQFMQCDDKKIELVILKQTQNQFMQCDDTKRQKAYSQLVYAV